MQPKAVTQVWFPFLISLLKGEWDNDNLNLWKRGIQRNCGRSEEPKKWNSFTEMKTRFKESWDGSGT